jgi:hypothetical protein
VACELQALVQAKDAALRAAAQAAPCAACRAAADPLQRLPHAPPAPPAAAQRGSTAELATALARNEARPAPPPAAGSAATAVGQRFKRAAASRAPLTRL